jgi:hypothetical protein
MEAEDQICTRYEAELAKLAALDRRFYLTPSPTLADRAAYAARQAQLEDTRSRLYAELSDLREYGHKQLRCRSNIRRHP